MPDDNNCICHSLVFNPSVMFLIISSGYNCQGYDKKCIESVLKLEGEFKAVFISDGSTDRTLRQVPSDKRIVVERFPDNQGAAKRRFDAIKKHSTSENDIIVLLGLDDEIFPDALTEIKKHYDAGKWMTYGNWINQHGVKLPEGFLDFDEKTHRNRSYRKVKYRATGLNTFYRFLFDQIPEDDFKINGKWIDSTTESELMFSCLEMCGKDRIGIVYKPIALYNESLPGGTLRRLGTEYKYQIYNQIIQRPRKPLLYRK